MQISNDGNKSKPVEYSTNASPLSTDRSEGGNTEQSIGATGSAGNGGGEGKSGGAGTAALMIVSQQFHDQVNLTPQAEGNQQPENPVKGSSNELCVQIPQNGEDEGKHVELKCVNAMGEGLKEVEEEEIEMINPYQLYLKTDPEKGKGVYTPKDIAGGCVIEKSSVLVITKEQWDEGKMNDSILGEYGFCWRAGGMGIGLGLGEFGFWLISNNAIED